MGNSRWFRALGALSLAGITALGATGGGPAHAAEGALLGTVTAGTVPDSYLVVLDRDAGVRGLAATAEGLVTKVGARLTRTFGSALHGFAVHASEEQARRLAAAPGVAYVARNQTLHALDTQPDPPSWGLDRVDQRDLPLDRSYTYPTEADTVTAYVLDTGVVADHPTFGGRVSGGRDVIDNDDDPADEHGHGTHVAGTIGGAEYGLAKGVRIVPVRVLGASGAGTTEQVVAGIDWVAEHAGGPAVANMSLGGGADEVLDEAVRGAIAKGVTFAVAAGNSRADAGNFSPARVREAITVAASDSTDRRASFSNTGAVVDLYAPGVDITSAWPGGTDKPLSGTSMAAPHVAGAAALHLADHPDATPEQVTEALTAGATAGKVRDPGAGTTDRLLHVAPR
ncbi:Peptidase inhibitor I9 [Amycolatopsis arida]|uniref:Peptidase inhibitor I9 n=1 Tax=Amycolatopsis arida TaxID=587909 RepID=A0A1I5KVK4_9PSEU|nr:S8 family peptidase [Amycolatopsis arida]TDX85857.1 peptidase inhibitor I9 [Amycolatopsis arida]SFO89139.1 Peptidase inhibitor I9 [Amycolatopsis arida]